MAFHFEVDPDSYEEQNPDPHKKNQDPGPHEKDEESDPDLLQSKRQIPDPHQSENRIRSHNTVCWSLKFFMKSIKKRKSTVWPIIFGCNFFQFLAAKNLIQLIRIHWCILQWTDGPRTVCVFTDP